MCRTLIYDTSFSKKRAPLFKIPGEKRGEATDDKSPDFPVVRHSKDVRKRTVLNFLYSGLFFADPESVTKV